MLGSFENAHVALIALIGFNFWCFSLQILSQISQFPGGHSQVMDAFDRQRTKFGEKYRFTLLILLLNNPKENDMHFKVQCGQVVYNFTTTYNFVRKLYFAMK